MQVGVVGVLEDGATVGNEVVVEFALRLLHALKGAEALQVRPADIGDKPIVRRCYLYQLAYVARVRSAHLHNSQLMVARELQQRERHANAVVQVALRVVDTILGAQHGSGQFLRGGLAVGTGDTNNGQPQLPPPIACQLLQADDAAALAGFSIQQYGAVFPEALAEVAIDCFI